MFLAKLPRGVRDEAEKGILAMVSADLTGDTLGGPIILPKEVRPAIPRP